MKNKSIKLILTVTAIMTAFSFFAFFNSASATATVTTLVFTTNCSLAPKDLEKCPRVSSFTTPAGYITLRWKLINDANYSCNASIAGNSSAYGNSENWSGPKPTEGQQQIFSGLPGSISYNLTCKDTAGDSVSSSITVNILPNDTSPTQTTSNNSLTSSNSGFGATTPSSSSGPSCDASGVKNLRDLIMNLLIGCIFNNLVYLIMLIAVAFFFWGIFKYLSAGESEKTKFEGKEIMFWGVIGLFVMISIWGIIAILQSNLKLGDNININNLNQPTVPAINTNIINTN